MACPSGSKFTLAACLKFTSSDFDFSYCYKQENINKYTNNIHAQG